MAVPRRPGRSYPLRGQRHPPHPALHEAAPAHLLRMPSAGADRHRAGDLAAHHHRRRHRRVHHRADQPDRAEQRPYRVGGGRDGGRALPGRADRQRQVPARPDRPLPVQPLPVPDDAAHGPGHHLRYAQRDLRAYRVADDALLRHDPGGQAGDPRHQRRGIHQRGLYRHPDQAVPQRGQDRRSDHHHAGAQRALGPVQLRAAAGGDGADRHLPPDLAQDLPHGAHAADGHQHLPERASLGHEDHPGLRLRSAEAEGVFKEERRPVQSGLPGDDGVRPLPSRPVYAERGRAGHRHVFRRPHRPYGRHHHRHAVQVPAVHRLLLRAHPGAGGAVLHPASKAASSSTTSGSATPATGRTGC